MSVFLYLRKQKNMLHKNIHKCDLLVYKMQAW